MFPRTRKKPRSGARWGAAWNLCFPALGWSQAVLRLLWIRLVREVSEWKLRFMPAVLRPTMGFLTSFGMTREKEWAQAAWRLPRLLLQRQWRFELIRRREQKVIPKQRFRTRLSGAQQCPPHPSP
jgi:hypothetical protein